MVELWWAIAFSLCSVCPAIAWPTSAARKMTRKNSERELSCSQRRIPASVMGEADHRVEDQSGGDQDDPGPEQPSHGGMSPPRLRVPKPPITALRTPPSAISPFQVGNSDVFDPKSRERATVAAACPR